MMIEYDLTFHLRRNVDCFLLLASLCLSTIAPLPAGYMLNAGYSWHLFFYVILAFSAALFVLAAFTVEESSYDRTRRIAHAPEVGEGKGVTAEEVEGVRNSGNESDPLPPVPARKSFAQTLSVSGRVDHDVSFFMTIVRSFTYFLVPQVMWVITTFGIIIGLGSFVVSFTFPIIIVQPPYLWGIVR